MPEIRMKTRLPAMELPEKCSGYCSRHRGNRLGPKRTRRHTAETEETTSPWKKNTASVQVGRPGGGLRTSKPGGEGVSRGRAGGTAARQCRRPWNPGGNMPLPGQEGGDPSQGWGKAEKTGRYGRESEGGPPEDTQSPRTRRAIIFQRRSHTRERSRSRLRQDR